MKSAWVMFCLLACLTSAHAQTQNGVSNARDANGNLVRSNGLNPTRGLTQPPFDNPARADHRSGAAAAPKPRLDNGAIH